jgi:type I restriction enzyme S subunit
VRTYLRNIAPVPDIYDGEIASTGFSVLRGEPGIIPGYLFYYSLTDEFVDELTERQRGTSYPAVRDSDVRSQPIPLAPLPEQQRIVEAIETQFTRLDAAVRALERAQANLARYKAAVLQAACEGRLVPTEAELHPDTYEPAAVLLERILAERRARWEEERWQYEIERAQKKAAQAERKAKGLPYYIRDLEPADWEDRTPDEYEPYLPKSDKWKGKYDEPEAPDTSELPAGWVWASVEQLADVGTGATPLRSKKEYYENGTIPWVTSGALNEPFVDSGTEFITELALEETNVKFFPAGTLLVAMYGEGKTRGKVSELKIDATTNQACAALVFEGTAAICKSYVKVFSLKNYDDIRRLSSGGVQPNLNLSIVRDTTFPLPPLAEQRRIVAEVERRLSVVEALEAAVEANLARAERLRQAILKRAFEGRLVPQDPDDEPASALLERIEAEREGG